MNLQRLSAFALTALSAGVLGMTSQTAGFPVGVTIIAAIGLLGVIPLPLRAERRVIFGLLVAAVFALKYRYAPLDARELNTFHFYPLAHAAAQYLITMQAANFYLHARRPLPAGFPFLTSMTLLAAGAIDASPAQQRMFFVVAGLFVLFSAIFFGASRPMARRETDRAAGRTAWVSAALILSLAGGAVFSVLISSYRSQVNKLLGGLRFDFYRPVNPDELPDRIELSSMDVAGFEQVAQQVALRVRSRRVPGYLRSQAFDTLDNSNWSSLAGWDALSPNAMIPGVAGEPDSPLHAFRIRSGVGRSTWQMTVWPTPGRQIGLPAPLTTTIVAAPVDEIALSEHGTTLADDLPLGVDFTLQVAEETRRDLLPGRLQRVCLELPARLRLLARPLALQITAGCDTPAEKMAAVERYFHNNYEYRLGIQIPRGVDPLTWFLLRRPPAHCEYFAAGAAVLLRAVDVPTRYVTGYVVSEKSPHGDYWLARRRDAHAWVEAYDPQQGWVTVEATPPAGRPTALDSRPHWLSGWWEHIRFQFQQLRVRLYKDGWRGLVGWLGELLLHLGRWLVTTIEGRVALAALLVLAGVLVRRRWQRRRRSGPPPTPHLRAMWRLRRTVDRRIRKLGLARRDDETLHQFALRLAEARPDEPLARSAADWYRAYARARSRPAPDAADLQTLRQTLPK